MRRLAPWTARCFLIIFTPPESQVIISGFTKMLGHVENFGMKQSGDWVIQGWVDIRR
jgi:uncharacterized membrane protein YjjB (DUF3815 family)